MPITPLPPAPNRTDGHATFVSKANAWVASLDTFTADANVLADNVSSLEEGTSNAAAQASASANIASASGAFVGRWIDQAGAAAIPFSVEHDDKLWMLLDDLADVTTSEPGVADNWVEIGKQLSTVGEIFMWPLDAPPDNSLMCNGDSYPYDIHPELGALLGGVPGGNFTVPDISFAKNSKGSNTGTEEAESVGTHGHTADAVASHAHSVSVASNGSHTHSVSAAGYTGITSGTGTAANDAASITGSAGAHTHSASAGAAGGHTPVINEHAGVNQPACTLVNFCIRTK